MKLRSCPACHGPAVLIGQLGQRVHCRCRNCGMDYSWVVKARKPKAAKQPVLPLNEEFSRNPEHRRGE